jgi:hypothetical protein
MNTNDAMLDPMAEDGNVGEAPGIYAPGYGDDAGQDEFQQAHDQQLMQAAALQLPVPTTEATSVDQDGACRLASRA